MYILMAKSTDFADKLDVDYERKKGEENLRWRQSRWTNWNYIPNNQLKTS